MRRGFLYVGEEGKTYTGFPFTEVKSFTCPVSKPGETYIVFVNLKDGVMKLTDDIANEFIVEYQEWLRGE
jgi:hypothetical protein